MHSDNNLPSAPRKPGKKTLCLILALPIAAFVLALLLFSQLLPVGRHKAFSVNEETILASSPAGGGLAAATDRSYRLYAVSGKCAASCASASETPLCSASAVCAAFADAGSAGITVLTPDGQVLSADTDGCVRFLHVNKSGLITVITEKEGATGFVTCFDSRLTPLFSWEAHSGYPLCARLSDNGLLAVCCTSPEGGQLHLYDITEEAELSSYSSEKILFLDFSFTEHGQIAVLSENSLLFLSADAKLLSEYPLGGTTVTAWCASASLVAVAAPSGSGSELLTFRPDGTLLAACRSDLSVLALSSAGESVLAVCPEVATLYNAELAEQISCQTGETVSRGYLSSEQTAVFVGFHEIRRIRLGR